MNGFIQQYQSGVQLYNGGHYEQALTSLKKALLEQPDFPDVYVLIARIYDELERYSDALSMYGKISRMLPNDLEVLRAYGRALIKAGEEKKGLNILHRVLKLNPRDIQARTDLARLYMRQGGHRKAFKLLEAGVKAAPEHAPFYQMAGDALRKMQKFSKAQSYYEGCLELDPECEGAKRGIDAVMRGQENSNGSPRSASKEEDAREEMLEAASLFSAQQYDEAILRLLDIKDRPGIEREATLMLGLAFTRKGLYKRAQDVFLAYLRNHPPDIRVLYNLGLSLSRMGRYSEAIDFLQQALEIDGEFEEALVELGIACQMTGTHNDARQLYVRALKMDRENPRPYAYLALLAYEYGDAAKMKEFLKRARASDPDCPEIALARATIMVREGKCEEALAPLNRCLERAPDHFEALKLMGWSRLKLDDLDGALDCYRAAAALNPNDDECSQMIRDLSG